MASSATTSTQNYKKRPGTSGIQGHLYETKLLSLIYFRAIHDDNIQDFHLATNVDKSGSFDDICFRAKVKGIVEPLVVFIQAKHRQNNSVLTHNSKSDLLRYYNSYLEIRSKFQPNNKDVLFNGKFSETKCIFVIYTTARGDRAARKNEDRYTTFLNELIGTEDLGSGLQPLDDSGTAKLIQILLEDEMTILARLMAKCIRGEYHDINMLMQEEVVLRYHVILAQQVFDVSEDQSEGYRVARFRRDFFDRSEELVQLFKEKLCEKVLKSQKIVPHVNVKQEIIQSTGNMTVISALQFRVPVSFGNKDLTIRGGDENKERKLIHLTKEISKLITKSRPSNIIKIHEKNFRETLEEGFLQLSGGIASAVGNLLVLDEDSKLLKFNNNYESLGELAKKLFDQLDFKIDNLYAIKFDMQVKIFPKLSFAADEYTRTMASDFFKSLLFYTSQAKEAKVEKILIEEIEKKLRLIDVHTPNVKSNTIFLEYHNDIQKWWKNEIGEYLRGDGSLYQNAKKHALSQPLMSFIDMMQRISNKKYTFIQDAVNSIKLDEQPPGTLVLTKNISLTVAKIINNQIEKSCVVLDMQYILNLSESDVQTLQTELIDLNKEIMFIAVCDKTIFHSSFDKTKLATITSSLRDKTVYIVLNDQDYVENAKKYFTVNENIIKDERNNLIDMTEESQKNFLENTNVVFQGVEVSLDQVLDEKSLGLVGEFALNKLMQSDTKYTIGKPACPLHYKGQIYIERSVKILKVGTHRLDANYRIYKERGVKRISTLFDLEDDVVLVIGDSGIGKTTLLNQLSFKTKQLDPSVWILRINLLDYSKHFFEWQDKEIVIDTLESLKFLCQVALTGENIINNDVQIEELNGRISLKDCDGDEWTVFELKMFLHYYNTKQLRIIFDGFDEMCPIYSHEVLSLIRTVINFRQKHKVWISSRTYDRIVTKLEIQFVYKIELLNSDDQDLFLAKFWEEKNILEDIDSLQVDLFYKFMSKSEDLRMHRKKSHILDESINEKPMLPVYLSLFKYLKPKFAITGFNFDDEPAPKFSGFVATPLHLKMVADHLYNEVTVINNSYKHGCKKSFSLFSPLTKIRSYTFQKLDLDTNIFEIYENYLENKLKIRFQEKNQIDMYRPYNIEQFEIEYAETKDNLKKLAAYVVYDKRLLKKWELKRCVKIIDWLKEGEEKTDIICNVVNDVPIFVHLTFAQHFAVEYICDLIKRTRNLKYMYYYNFILNVMFFELDKNVLVILDAKIKHDKELITIMEKDKKEISRLLLEQGKLPTNEHGCIRSALFVAIRFGLRNLASFLLSTLEEYMNESDLLNFIEIVKATNMLMMAVKMEFDDHIIRIIDKVRSINESKLSALFEKYEIFDKNYNFARESTTELVQKLHASVWTRMDIVPEWKNLAELISETYFI